MSASNLTSSDPSSSAASAGATRRHIAHGQNRALYIATLRRDDSDCRCSTRVMPTTTAMIATPPKISAIVAPRLIPLACSVAGTGAGSVGGCVGVGVGRVMRTVIALRAASANSTVVAYRLSGS
jgi:hypothetical protein